MPHPMVESLGTLRAVVAELAGFEPLYVPTPQKAELIRSLLAVEAQVASVRMKVLAAAGDVAEEAGAKDPASWLIGAEPVDPARTRAEAKLAAGLERWTATAAALTAGDLSVAQAQAVVDALDAVTDHLSAAQLVEAEQVMVTAAKELDPARLRKTGRRLVDVVDPEGAEEREAERLAEEDKRAAEKAKLSLRPQGDGTTRISGRLPNAVAKKLEGFLEAFAQPRKQAAQADGRRPSYPTLMARAMGDLMDRIAPEQLPAHGGDATTMIVTISLDSLRSGLGSAGLGFDEDTPISVDQARRLACEAQIIPVVLGSHGQVLDAGRKARLHNPIQRKLIRLRDKRCRAAGCTVKAEWCEVHHLLPWSRGGKTSVKDGTLLCSHHHHLVHDPAYLHERMPDGSFRFAKRT